MYKTSRLEKGVEFGSSCPDIGEVWKSCPLPLETFLLTLSKHFYASLEISFKKLSLTFHFKQMWVALSPWGRERGEKGTAFTMFFLPVFLSMKSSRMREMQSLLATNHSQLECWAWIYFYSDSHSECSLFAFLAVPNPMTLQSSTGCNFLGNSVSWSEHRPSAFEFCLHVGIEPSYSILATVAVSLTGGLMLDAVH